VAASTGSLAHINLPPCASRISGFPNAVPSPSSGKMSGASNGLSLRTVMVRAKRSASRCAASMPIPLCPPSSGTRAAKAEISVAESVSIPLARGRSSERSKSCGTQTVEQVSRFTRASSRAGAPGFSSVIRIGKTTSS
jgi:hypothetical protein